MAELGWEVKDEGRMLAMNERGHDLYVLSLYGGNDDGHPVSITITYKERPPTRNFCFTTALVEWPLDDVQSRATTQTRLWELIEAYAPKGGD